MSQELLTQIIHHRHEYKGLTSAQAEARLREFGHNSRKPTKKKNSWQRAWHIATEPMMLFLIAGAAVYFFVGKFLETAILLGSIIPIVLMEFFQEQHVDKTLEALDKIMETYCMVWRDGKTQKLEIKFLAPGDLVYLTAGDKIPADGILLKSPGLMIDESMLTGESLAVAKSETPVAQEKINREHQLWQGTVAVQGEGELLVLATGEKTTYGHLETLVGRIKSETTPLQKKINQLVRYVAAGAIFVALSVGILLSFKHDLVAGLLGGITMAISLIPEEFPIVFNVFLIMGVWRLARKQTLVRDMAKVEMLGSATVICSDKTGTLTQGQMSLEQVYTHGRLYNVKDKEQDGHFTHLIKSALLSLEQVAVDPMEVEIQRFAKTLRLDAAGIYDEHVLIQDSTFSTQTKMVHHLWQEKSGACFQYTAGAPEAVLAHCNLPKEEKDKTENVLSKMTEKGWRVIAIAERPCAVGEKIAAREMRFVGLLAMSDPPREGVKEALAACQTAGIRVIMITGDNKLTAHTIAEQIGLAHHEEIITGDDLKKLSPAALKQAVLRHEIFARIEPEQKYLIVEALQSAGEIVAMTGDGVNDAPALKKAHLGIAMGQRGTEAARAAASMVLLDDNFATIVTAVKEGRRIYDNLRQAFVFLFSFHLPIVGLAILPLFFGQPLIFFPIHVIFLELICDPAAVLGFDREKARYGLMNEPPRSTNEPIINHKHIKQILLRGLGILTISFGLYYWAAIYGSNIVLGRTLAFSSLVISQVLLILLSREWQQVKSNPLLLSISGLTLVALAAILFIPTLREVFYFGLK
ncbi:MAG: cation-transporting P-type ATPase [Candidatus Magasanikbacteria bacterium]|nr:cation-transporting P-type ATPase [Candidatus Magasanikbacteria bacterium]